MNPRPIVIGIAGGIGAGKSSVAAVLGDAGCLVVDSDLAARAALDRPEVKSQLRAWWGDSIISSGGGIDRSAIAAIVFADPAERVRLEGLIHPMVKADREDRIVSAQTDGVAAVVVDAPLLFEAGVDRECDVTIFVDAPAETRARRTASRGWAPDELARRERAQWPLERKRELADYVVVNDSGPEELRARVLAVLKQILCNTPGR